MHAIMLVIDNGPLSLRPGIKGLIGLAHEPTLIEDAVQSLGSQFGIAALRASCESVQFHSHVKNHSERPGLITNDGKCRRKLTGFDRAGDATQTSMIAPASIHGPAGRVDVEQMKKKLD
jgi:hypothetical protein